MHEWVGKSPVHKAYQIVRYIIITSTLIYIYIW